MDGRSNGVLHASEYPGGGARLMDAVMESFARLVVEFDQFERVIVEGASSPAEVKPRAGGTSPTWDSRGGR